MCRDVGKLLRSREGVRHSARPGGCGELIDYLIGSSICVCCLTQVSHPSPFPPSIPFDDGEDLGFDGSGWLVEITSGGVGTSHALSVRCGKRVSGVIVYCSELLTSLILSSTHTELRLAVPKKARPPISYTQRETGLISHSHPCFSGSLSRPESRSPLSLTWQGRPPSIGNVRLFLLLLSGVPCPPAAVLSVSMISSKSKSLHIWTRIQQAMSSAIFFPRQERGPPLKTGNSKAVLVISFTALSAPSSSSWSAAGASHRSGRKRSESSPQRCRERFMAHIHHMMMLPLGRNVWSGSRVST